jgi:hypothetical protein
MLSVWRNGCLGNKLEGESSWRRDMAIKGAGGNPGAVTKKGGDGTGGSTGTGARRRQQCPRLEIRIEGHRQEE